MDLQRLLIPSVVDGLTPDQRKILFCAFKRNLVKEVKVLPFCDYVAQHSAYWHSKESLAHTLVGMAQSFVGTNNINLMYPAGNFGTRYHGQEDRWETPHVFTKLSPITRSIFPEDDDVLLNYLQIKDLFPAHRSDAAGGGRQHRHGLPRASFVVLLPMDGGRAGGFG
ncbi:unnamed protein product [Urochloa humidicola]